MLLRNGDVSLRDFPPGYQNGIAANGGLCPFPNSPIRAIILPSAPHPSSRTLLRRADLDGRPETKTSTPKCSLGADALMGLRTAGTD